MFQPSAALWSEINILAAELSARVDDADASGVAALFAEDGEIVAGGTVIRGRRAIEDYIAASSSPAVTTRHAFTNLRVLSADASAASADMILLLTVVRDGKADLVVGAYSDEYARVGADWRLKSRKITITTRIKSAG